MALRWSSVRKALRGQSADSLLTLIKELYELRPENRTFLQARIVQASAGAEPYRKRIREAVSPDPTSRKEVRLADGRRAVSEYERAVAEPVQAADVMLYYVECGTRYAADFGYEDDRFFRSLELMFANVLAKLGDAADPSRDDLIDRIEDVIELAGKTGWGYQDELRAQFEQWAET